MKRLFSCLFLLTLLISCKPSDADSESAQALLAQNEAFGLLLDSTFQFPYQIAIPDTIIYLPFILMEISGLDYDAESQQLVAVNDEQGKVFFLNKQSGDLQHTVNFRKSGDYEGICLTRDSIYITKSNGSLVVLGRTGEKEGVLSSTYNTLLRPDNDVEGLAYDQPNNRLLMACKGDPALKGSDNDYIGSKAVYSFNLKENKVERQPAMLIQQEAFAAYRETLTGNDSKFEKWVHKNFSEDFAPSGIAIHPVTKHYYLISSPAKLLAILNQRGELIYIGKLNSKHNIQPEGICFDDKANLFIANEGRGGKGRLIRYNYKSPKLLSDQ